MFYYGCAIIGPSGSGKSTLCNGLKQLTTSLDRKSIIINLDPASETHGDIDIQDLITLSEVMEHYNLGPNGALLYCFDFLKHNIEWLQTQIAKYKDHYLIFDFPGQIELYVQNDSLKEIVQILISNKQPIYLSLVAVQLTDILNCYQENLFISCSLTNLAMQMNLELPYLCVLTKLDLIKSYGPLPMSLQYIFEGTDFSELLRGQSTSKQSTFIKLIAGLLDDTRRISFEPLYVESKQLMVRLLLKIDLCNGYYYLESLPQLYRQMQEEFHGELDEVSTDLLFQIEDECL